jgi:hypothetical protein
VVGCVWVAVGLVVVVCSVFVVVAFETVVVVIAEEEEPEFSFAGPFEHAVNSIASNDRIIKMIMDFFMVIPLNFVSIGRHPDYLPLFTV